MTDRTTSNDAWSPSRLEPAAQDAEFFQRHLDSFVPPDVFDVHAHLYPHRDGDIDFARYRNLTSGWMGQKCATGGLFFALPSTSDIVASNQFIASQIDAPVAGLLLVRPNDDPSSVEDSVNRLGFAGFKVYHTFATRPDTPNADIDEYVPEWIWELAHRRSLVIMLHLVKQRALADPVNLRILRENLRRFSGARVILAHAGRGFCAQHTIEGVHSLAGLDNVFFDSSAICEPGALLAILQEFGPGRLMYGSDFPVSNMRGRAISVGDGFTWLYEHNFDWTKSAHGQPTLIGIESLLALKQAAGFARLKASEIEGIFSTNALAVLGKHARP